MKETLYRYLSGRSPQARERYEALRRSGEPRWKAAPVLLGAVFSGGKNSRRPLPQKGSESALSYRETPERLVEKLRRFDVVSFDIFDTLLLRAVDQPKDAFFFVGAKLGYPDFQRLRVEAESRAREKKRRIQGAGEVTLEEIWAELKKTAAVPPQQGMAVELEVERALCRGNPYFLPVVEGLRKLGKPMVLLSDMYLPGEFLEKLVEEAGFGKFQGLLVSGEKGDSKWEGGLFRRLREQFPEKVSFAHIGDNPYSDVKQAREQGATPFFYKNVNQAGGPFRAKDMSPVVGSVYRGLVNGKLHHGGEKYSVLYEYGFVYGGLFALGYCRFIRHMAQQCQADRLLFLSRDGEALLKLYRRLYPQDERPVYAYWSRLAAAKITAGLFPWDYFRRFLWHKAEKGLPLKEVMRSMELSPLLPELCAALGLSPTVPLTHKNAGAVQNYLTAGWSRVLELYEPQRRAAGAYYRQLLSGSFRAMAVDIGWAGSGAVALWSAAEKLWGLDCKITGLLAGTNSAHSPERDAAEPLLLTGKLRSYLFSQGENRDLWNSHDPRQGHNLFWELLLGGEEGSLKGFYPSAEKGWRLEFSPNPHAGAVREIHRGLLDFGEEFLNLERRLGIELPISGRDAYGPMLEVLAAENAPYRRGLEVLLDEPGIG